MYQNQRRYADAEPLYKRSLAILERALGPDHPDIATSLNNLAAMYGAQGREADAEPLYKRALAIREKTTAPSDQK
jgi:tetratricopeptide (TPR) repeat protein